MDLSNPRFRSAQMCESQFMEKTQMDCSVISPSFLIFTNFRAQNQILMKRVQSDIIFSGLLIYICRHNMSALIFRIKPKHKTSLVFSKTIIKIFFVSTREYFFMLTSSFFNKIFFQMPHTISLQL